MLPNARRVVAIALLSLVAATARAESIAQQIAASHKAALKDLKSFVSATLAAQNADLDDVENAIKTGQLNNPEALTAAADALGPRIGSVVAKAADVTADAAIADSAALSSSILFYVKGSLIGDGGAVDGFHAKVEEQLTRYRTKTLKRLAQHRKRLADRSDGTWHVNFTMPELHVWGAPRVNNPNTTSGPDHNMWMPRVLLLLAGGGGAALDGRIEACVQGQAICFGTKINIRLSSPANGDAMRTGLDCGGGTGAVVRATFTGLHEGNHLLFVDQRDVGGAPDFSRPMEFAAIGTP